MRNLIKISPKPGPFELSLNSVVDLSPNVRISLGTGRFGALNVAKFMTITGILGGN